jgi:hypothetical protein
VGADVWTWMAAMAVERGWGLSPFRLSSLHLQSADPSQQQERVVGGGVIQGSGGLSAERGGAITDYPLPATASRPPRATGHGRWTTDAHTHTSYY